MKLAYFLAWAGASGALVVACAGKSNCTENRTCGYSSPAAGAGGSGTSGGGAGGEAGMAEAGTGGATPMPGDACSLPNAIVCQGHAQAKRLVCQSSQWQPTSDCQTGELCDSTDGSCSLAVPECVAAMPGDSVCRVGDIPLSCGPDLVTASVRAACAGVCLAGVCQDPVCGDGKLEPGEACEDDNAVSGDGCYQCTKVVSVATSGLHSCVLLSSGAIKCWGSNQEGQLGLGDTNNRGDEPGEVSALEPVDLGAHTVTSLALGYYFTCALLEDKSVRCWGDNAHGELGLGDTNNRGDEPGEMGDHLEPVDLGGNALLLAAGVSHACAILDDGSVKCWGENDSGQLGLGATNARGDDAGEMGTMLPAVALGTSRKAKALALGAGHSCAILDDDTVKCWGAGSAALGNDSTAPHGSDANQMGDNLPIALLGSGRTAKSLCAGNVQTCAVLDDGSLKCWGGNASGQLGVGVGPQISYGDTPGSMASLPAVNLGSGRTALSVACSYESTCALLDDHSVWCWGANANGQLGVPQPPSNLPVGPVDLGTGRSTQQLSGGAFQHTCALLNDDTVKCWGNNVAGQLGLGDPNNRGAQIGQMGNELPTVPVP